MIHELRPATPELALEHFGVKGMRWGVQKEDTGSGDITLAKGQKVYNISSKNPRALEGHIFGGHTERDVLNYRGTLASTRVIQDGSAYSNQFIVKKDLKIASEKTQVAEFKKLWDTDKDAVVDSLALAQKNMKLGAAIMNTVFKQDRTDVYRERLAAKGEKWVQKKGMLEFSKSLGAESGSKSAEVMRRHYTKLGYDALLDLNDIKSYGSKEPVIYLTPKKSLNVGTVIPLTKKDIQAARNAYVFEKDRKKYGSINTLHT